MQRLIYRTFVQTQQFFADLLNAASNAIAVERSKSDK
jgi:hypothetical protein